MIFYEDSHMVILFESKDKPSSEVNENSLSLNPSFSEVKKRFDKPALSQVLGLIIFVVSFVGFSLTLGPVLVSELSFRLSQLKKETIRIVKNQPVKAKRLYFGDILGKAEFEEIATPVDTNFGIVIPKIGVNVKVLPNIDAGKPQEFSQALKQGVAHAAGTALPNQEGLVFIFGHSTNYAWNVSRFNAVFYQIKDLEIGDEVNLFYNGQRYFYKVAEKRIIKADDLSFLNESNGGRKLILQTCWPPGTTKERILIFANPVRAQIALAP